MIDSTADWLRTLNALLGVAVLVLIFPRLMFVWTRFSRGQRAIFTALVCYVVANVYGGIELILLGDNRFSVRTVIVLVGHAMMLAYLLEPRTRYHRRLGEDPLDPHMPDRHDT